MNRLTCMIALGSLCLTACDPVTMGLVTASGGMAVNHQMAATATRTFSDTAQGVQHAVLAALEHMSMVVRKREQRGDVEVIQATAGNRNVSLRLEPVTRTSTLLEVSVHQDLLTMDGATAREIVAQTEHALGSHLSVLTIRDDGRATPADAHTEASATAEAPGRTTYYGRDEAPGRKSDEADKNRAARSPKAGHALPPYGST